MGSPIHEEGLHLESLTHESSDEWMRGTTSIATLATGISWNIGTAFIRDCRRFNPFFNIWCDFVFPRTPEFLPPPRASALDVHYGRHLSVVT